MLTIKHHYSYPSTPSLALGTLRKDTTKTIAHRASIVSRDAYHYKIITLTLQRPSLTLGTERKDTTKTIAHRASIASRDVYHYRCITSAIQSAPIEQAILKKRYYQNNSSSSEHCESRCITLKQHYPSAIRLTSFAQGS